MPSKQSVERKSSSRRMSATFCFVLTSVVTPGAAFGPSVQAAFASGSCGSSSAANFLGYDESHSGWGAEAYVTTRVASFCSGTDPIGSQDRTASWSMITPSSKPEGAQSGYVKFNNGNSNYYIFSQYTDLDKQSNYPATVCTNITPTTTCCGDVNEYYSLYSSSSGGIEMWWVNGSGTNYKLATTYYNPTVSYLNDNYWPGPWVEQFNSETYNTGN
jgi:hypothetical protein